MKQVKLPVQERKEIGNHTAKRCRKSGGIPAVIYGESGVKHLVVSQVEFAKIQKNVISKAVLLDLDFGDGSEGHYAVIKDIERDSVSCEILHIDFLEVVRGKPMHAVIPLRIFGESIGVKNSGGVIDIHHHEVKVVCRPKDLPEEIVLDITELDGGCSLSVADLPKLEGVEYNEAADRTLVTCFVSAKAEEEAAAATAEA